MRLIAAMLGLGLATIVALTSVASANQYEIFIDIETEEDLYNLLEEQQITEDTFDTLLELYQRGVNLNTATRQELYSLPNLSYIDVDGILTYRTEAGWIQDPADLVVNGVLTDRKFLAIAPFLVLTERTQALGIDGRVRALSRFTSADDRAPPAVLQARVRTLDHLKLGLVTSLTRNRLDNVRYDPNRDALAADQASPRVHAPKFYAYWDTEDFAAIAGTYRIGFGQRLTFDTSREYTPNGIFPDHEFSRKTELVRACKESTGELGDTPCPVSNTPSIDYITPDFRWQDSLLGAAVGLKNLALGPGVVQAHAFASYQPRSIYQYEIVDRATGETPAVFNVGDNLAEPASAFSFHTLPSMFAEATAGGNVTFFAQRRVHFGLTGYGSTVNWLAEGIELDFKPSARRPAGGPFGAIGFDFAWGYQWADLFFEAAHSFDSIDDDSVGGAAAIVRGTATWHKREIEASFRYYGTDFANPYARPIAAPDEFEGIRARDEAGARLRYSGVHRDRINLRAAADFWTRPSAGDALQAEFRLRADIDATEQLRWGVWGEYDSNCLDTLDDLEDAELTETINCDDSQLKLTGRVAFAPSDRYSFAGQVDHKTLFGDMEQRQDISARVTGLFKPTDTVRAQVRVRYLFEDLSDNMRLEQFIFGYAKLTVLFLKKHRAHLRYDARIWMDERERTDLRVPSPEHSVWLELDSRF